MNNKSSLNSLNFEVEKELNLDKETFKYEKWGRAMFSYN